MRIGFAGAHRTGKTTLAKAVAEKLGCRFVATNVSKAPVWEEIQVSPSDQFTFAERLEIQHRLMDYLDKQYETQTERAYVADRTSLDILGYLFANLDSTCSDLWTASTRALVSRAITSASNHFDKIFLVQPGIHAVTDIGKSGKVFMSEIYQTAINNNIIAFGINHFDSSKFMIMPPNITKLEDRITYTLAVIQGQ